MRETAITVITIRIATGRSQSYPGFRPIDANVLPGENSTPVKREKAPGSGAEIVVDPSVDSVMASPPRVGG
jgi:hypothetical protein